MNYQTNNGRECFVSTVFFDTVFLVVLGVAGVEVWCWAGCWEVWVGYGGSRG